MGCLNFGSKFSHWFGNIHLSGPCNAKCYFCIGQHMMQLDRFNVLDKWPLEGVHHFTELCQLRRINLTCTNTDPLLYKHLWEMKGYLKAKLPNLVFGCRTNGLANRSLESFDKVSFSIPSFNPNIYKKLWG